MNIEITNTGSYKRIMLMILVSFMSFSFFAQIKKGDKMFSKFEFEKALTAYEKEYNDNTTANPYLTRRIGLTYRNLGDIEASAIWFKRTLDLDQSNSLDYLYYAEALKYIKEYDKSLEYYRLFNEKSPNDSRAIEHLNNPTYYQKLVTDTSQYTIKKLIMNTDIASFGVTKYHDNYLFSSTGTPNPEVTQNYNMFDDNPYLDIFTSTKDEENELIDILRVKGEINSKFHDGPSCFDGVNGQLYVTRNNVKRNRPVKDATGRVNLKIYVFDELGENEWGKAQELPFNSDAYSVAHPSISYDGNSLYFSSNQVGGYGGTDIYVCKRTNGGMWGEPLNLGPQINTEGDESFPFITEDGSLFFSSDGHPGLGGLDVFKAENKNGKWMAPVNLAHPINSEKDDISFITEPDEKSGYFSSNRSDEHIGDDIYSFSFTPLIKVNAFVRDKYTMLPIEGVIARIYDEDGYVVFEGQSDENGYLEISITKGKCNYVLKVGENLDYADYNFDLNLCDEENRDDIVDLGIIEWGSMEYNVAVNVKDAEANELMADATAKVYDMETKELLFESAIGPDGKLKYGFQTDKNYRIDVDHNGYQTSSHIITPKDVTNGNLILDFALSQLSIKGISETEKDYNLALTVKDVERQELVADVYAKIYDMETKELIFGSIVADDGKLAMALAPDKDYRIDITHADYETSSTEFTTRDLLGNEIPVRVDLRRKQGEAEVAKTYDLENIYYDFDKSNIRADAKKTLDNLVAFMNDNPEVIIDMDSHTDSRGTNAYNMKLSNRREEAAMNYLLKAGIDASRLTAAHHGEEQLANNCTDNVKCSENAHQLNRRTTFRIVNPNVLANTNSDEKIIYFEDIAQEDTGADYDFDFMMAA